MEGPPIASELRQRMSTGDAHYAGRLVDGARILALFGDLATEIAIRCDGDEGLFRAYESVEFLAPVMAGDYIRAEARLVGIGTSSRRIEFKAFKEIAPAPSFGPTAADLLNEPILVATAVGTVVVPVDRMRESHRPSP